MDRNLVQKLAQKHASGERTTITADFSCLDKEEQQDMVTLRTWQEDGLVEIKAAEEIEKEFERANPNIKHKLEKQYSETHKLFLEDPAIYGRARYGRFKYGGEGTQRDGKGIDYYEKEFKNIMFPAFDKLGDEKRVNAYYDVMHIATHHILKRDIFLTRNTRHFKPEKLRKKFEDLNVLTPRKCVELLQQIFS